MNRLLSLIGSVILLTCAPLATAYPIENIVTINRVLQVDEPLNWVHDLTLDGYVPGTAYDQFSLTLELRDQQDYPDKDVLDRPFFILYQEQGRSYGRVTMEDLVVDGPIHIDANGLVRPGLVIMEGEVWIGRAIVRAEISDPLVVPEPGSLGLLVMGLLLMAVRVRSKGL
jgi:hypothetical protein